MSALPAYELGSSSLPAYDAGDSDALPPTFKIDKAYTTPLVSVSDVKAHLVILGAFRVLRESVLSESSPIDPEMRDDVKWTLFLTRAALRFEAWVEYVVKKQARIRGEIPPGLLDYEIPPLDVLMCFHAYLLNPCLFFHDCEAMYPELRQIGGFPLASIAFRVNPDTFEYEPSIIQIEEWELATRQNFNPPLATSFDCRVEITCPRCGTSKEVPVMSPLTAAPVTAAEEEDSENGKETWRGTGYAQSGFSTVCESCGLPISRDVFSANNVARDIARASNDMILGRKTFLNGNLLGAKGKVAADLANHFPSLILRTLEPFEVSIAPDKRIAYGKLFGWNTARAQKMIEYATQKPGGPRPWHYDFMRRSFRGYRQPQPFSIDFVGAIMRQFKFTEQVHKLGWTSPIFQGSHAEFIVESIHEYHLFLDMSKPSMRPLVPTLSIDLSWHTHMLSGEKYHQDCLRYLDRFLDHDDRVEEGILALFYKETQQMWETRFKTTYGQLPTSSPMTESAASRISNMLQLPALFRPSRSNSTASVNTLQVPDRDDGDTESIGGSSVHGVSYGSTEPSTHNSVLAFGDHDSTMRRKSRESSARKVNKQARQRERSMSTPAAGVAVSLARTRSTGSAATAASDIEHPFLKQAPEDGVGAAGFAALGAAGWDVWGPRDAHILDGAEVRGDCCTGVTVSCASITRDSIQVREWVHNRGNPGQLE